MSEKEQDTGEGANGSAAEDRGRQISVLGQYIRDLSFENPRAPKSLQGPGEDPNLKVEVNVNGRKLGEDTFESVIMFNAKATNKEGALYELELQYAGAFRLTNISDELAEQVMMIQCPALLFPFLRRLVADLTREGGFPPLLLDPIDFAGLYAHNAAKAGAEASNNDDDNANGDDEAAEAS